VFTAGALTCAADGSWRALAQEGEWQGGGSGACRLHLYALSLALVDWFSSAEYGELQLVQEAYKVKVN